MALAPQVGQTRTQRIGWVMLMLVGAIFLLDGIVWFFVGPSVFWFKDATGVPLDEFRSQYPVVADHLSNSARQVAIWLAAFGTLAIAIAVDGFRNGTRWAWIAGWIVVIFVLALGVNYAVAGENAGVLGFTFGGAVLGTIGLLLSRRSG